MRNPEYCPVCQTLSRFQIDYSIEEQEKYSSPVGEDSSPDPCVVMADNINISVLEALYDKYEITERSASSDYEMLLSDLEEWRKILNDLQTDGIPVNSLDPATTKNNSDVFLRSDPSVSWIVTPDQVQEHIQYCVED